MFYSSSTLWVSVIIASKQQYVMEQNGQAYHRQPKAVPICSERGLFNPIDDRKVQTDHKQAENEAGWGDRAGRRSAYRMCLDNIWID